MFYTVLLVILLANSALTKPRYADLSEDEQELFRAAYDTPSYDQNELEEEDDMHLGKLDLLKDGLWAVKAKLKELKAFNKALAANLLSTKLRVKELLANQMRLKNHHHHDAPEKKYPVHNYQPQPYPSYEAQVPQYGVPQYGHDPYYGH